MKKIIALAIAAMMVVAGMFVFVGCGDDTTEAGTTAPSVPGTPDAE